MVDSPYVKELSIVGLPMGSEKRGVPRCRRREYDIALSRAELRRRVEETFPSGVSFASLLQARQTD